MKIPKIIMAVDTAFVDADPRSTYEIGFSITETDKGIYPELIRSKQYYIKPDPEYPYERTLHGQTVKSDGDKVIHKGQAHEGLEMKKVIEFLHKAAAKVDCFCAHNAQADHSRLRRLAEKFGMPWPEKPWLNTMPLFRKLENSKKGNLELARQKYNDTYHFGKKNSQEDAKISLAIALEAIKRKPILLQECYHQGSVSSLTDIDFKILQARQTLFEELEERVVDPVIKKRIDQLLMKIGIKMTLSDGLDHFERAEFLDMNKSRIINQVIIRCLDDDSVRQLADPVYYYFDKDVRRMNIETLRKEILDIYDCGDGFVLKSEGKQVEEKREIFRAALNKTSIETLRSIVENIEENYQVSFDGLLDKRRKESLVGYIESSYAAFFSDLENVFLKPDLIAFAKHVGASFSSTNPKEQIAEAIRDALDPLSAS